MADLIVHSFDPVVLVGGADIGPEEINKFSGSNPCFVGVDGGAEHLRVAGVTPTAVIGDLDSLSEASADLFADVLHHVPEQDTVDFEKAITRVDAPLIYAVGFSGGRLDHVLAVLNVMGRHADRPIVLVGPDDVAAVVPQRGLALSNVEIGIASSVMPLTRSTVAASGLRWDINDKVMEPLGFASPSNEAIASTLSLSADGTVLLILPRSHLQQLTAAIMG